MPNQFPSADTVKISDIQLIDIPSRRSTYSVEISNGRVTERLQNKKVDGSSIVWPDSLSFISTDLADQSLWYFKIIKNKLKLTVGSYKIEGKLLDLLQSQKDHGSCKLTVFKGCQLKFTIERLGDALPELVNDVVEDALAQTSTSKRPAEIANLVMKTHDFFESQEDPWMSFLPHFKTFMSIVDTIAEVHPYVQLAWSILSIIPKTIISQNERDDSINKLSQHLKEVYEYITDAKRLPTLKETQRNALSVLVQQTIECAYFLKEYAASNKGKILKGVNIDKKVDDLNKNFDHILNIMTNSTALETNIVTLRVSHDIGEVREKVEELKDLNLLGDLPHAQNAGFLSEKVCLPGTRQGLITEILHWVNASDGGSERVFLLLGQAGTGKSAVAHTISQLFDKQNRLGSVFCFNRSYKENRNVLFSNITRGLADGDVQWRKSLVQIIEKTSIRTSLDIRTQFDELIVKPSKTVNTIGPVVIVIDALDESGDRGERAVLLDLLFQRCSELPSNYRFVITSRPEPDIEPLCKHPTVFCKRMADIDPAETTKDIQGYISSRLSSVENILNNDLNIDWRLTLANRAEGLFQWAKLACDVINPNVEFGVTGRAKKFISGSTSSLYQVYHEIFSSRPEFEEEGYLSAFRTVMGALVIMRRPLSIQALQSLFQNVFPHKIEPMMAPFHSLFLGTHDLHTPVRPLHTSLTDFLTARSIEVINDAKKTTTLNLFYVDTSDQGYFTLACLKLMNSGEGGLRFNICNLETSHVRNQDVPDLDDRVQKEIPSHLSYASYFWAVHLKQSKVSEDLRVQLHLLIRTNILFLFEILSLLEKSVDQVCISMKILADWCKGVPDDELASQAEDACQFGYDFGEAMVKSTPHLYISALAFAPNGSFIRNQYLDRFPHHFNIELGQSLKSPRSSNVMKRHPNSWPTTAVAFSPQGRYIATGFQNGDFWLWDYRTGEMAVAYQWGTSERDTRPYQWELGERNSGICMIVFSPNVESVTSCLLDGNFKTLNIQKNELVSHSYGAFEYPCRYSTISNDGRYIVFHSRRNEVSLYNTMSRSTIQLGFLSIESIFSPNGELLASLVDSIWPNTISMWSIQKQELIGSLRSETPIKAMAFSPNGSLALCCKDIVQIWDVLTVAKVREFAFDLDVIPSYSGCSLICFPNGQNLFFITNLDIQIMDVSTGVLVRSLPYQHYRSANSLAVSSDLKHVAWAMYNGEIQVHECESTPRRADPINGGLVYLRAMFSPLNTYLVLQGYDGTLDYLQILNTATMTITARLQLKNCLVSISPNDEYIAYLSTHGLCLWSDKGGELVLDSSARGFTTLMFSFAGDRLISGDDSGTLMVWNTHTCQFVCSPYTVMPSETQIMALAFSRTGIQFLVAYRSGSNDVIEIHSSQSGKLLRGPFIPHSVEESYTELFTLAFSANETHIVYIRPWIGFIIDTGTGQILKTLELSLGAASLDQAYEISPNRRYLMLKGDEKVDIWDIDTGEEVDGKYDCHARRGVFSNSSEEMAIENKRGEINFWDISSGNKSTRPMFYYYLDDEEWESTGRLMNDKYLVLVRRYVLEIWSLETHQIVSQHHQSNSREPCTSSVDNSAVEPFVGAIHNQISSCSDDQERTKYALVAWKNALFSESSEIDKDGWVLGPNKELLFWVPKERRKGLWRPKMVHLAGAPITKLTFENFVHGSEWTKCKEKF